MSRAVVWRAPSAKKRSASSLRQIQVLKSSRPCATPLFRTSSFRLQAHEVTNGEYRRFAPGHDDPSAPADLPAVNVTWADDGLRRMDRRKLANGVAVGVRAIPHHSQ